MEWLNYYFIQNFILLCIFVVVIVNLIQNYNIDKKTNFYSIVVMIVTILLSIAITLENYGKSIASVPLTTAFSVFGYVVRPVVTYLFIRMSYKGKDTLFFRLSFIPLIINAIIYFLSFIPSLKEYIVYFGNSPDGNGISFNGGPLRFTSHIIALLYIIWWFYISFTQIRTKHIRQGLTIILCAMFVILSVVIETFLNDSGKTYLLNTTIGLSVLTYYLFVHTERTQLDALTNLYKRETFYRDVPRMLKTATGIIQFDLNGLKFLNDNYGHLEGDKAISTISKIILSITPFNMYGYRLGGDEFTFIVNNMKEEDIVSIINKIKDEIDKTNYSCSIGYSYKNSDDLTIEKLMKIAEENMYKDKKEYYKKSGLTRRNI